MLSVVVVGGGAAVNALRQRAGDMTEESVHWEAIGCMERNAMRFAADHGFARLQSIDEACQLAPHGKLVVLTRFADPLRTSVLPMNWTVTSDSIAAWFAAESTASELVLLKSWDGSDRSASASSARAISASALSASALSAVGVVDAYFPVIANRISFRVVNLRSWLSAGA
jgi:aspartokinase-like uncharacterized kinase